MDKEFSSNQESKFPATLNIGTVELSLDDLLMLRPGMTISFEKPTHFQATVEVGGQPWAMAAVHIGESEVELKVETVCRPQSNLQETTDACLSK